MLKPLELIITLQEIKEMEKCVKCCHGNVTPKIQLEKVSGQKKT